MRFPRQKRVQQSISWYSAPLWEEMEEGLKHGVIIAETEEQEPAEIGHAALCVQSSGERRKISVYEFSPAYKIGCRERVCALCVAGQAGVCGANVPWTCRHL